MNTSTKLAVSFFAVTVFIFIGGLNKPPSPVVTRRSPVLETTRSYKARTWLGEESSTPHEPQPTVEFFSSHQQTTSNTGGRRWLSKKVVVALFGCVLLAVYKIYQRQNRQALRIVRTRDIIRRATISMETIPSVLSDSARAAVNHTPPYNSAYGTIDSETYGGRQIEALTLPVIQSENPPSYPPHMRRRAKSSRIDVFPVPQTQIHPVVTIRKSAARTFSTNEASPHEAMDLARIAALNTAVNGGGDHVGDYDDVLAETSSAMPVNVTDDHAPPLPFSTSKREPTVTSTKEEVKLRSLERPHETPSAEAAATLHKNDAADESTKAVIAVNVCFGCRKKMQRRLKHLKKKQGRAAPLTDDKATTAMQLEFLLENLHPSGLQPAERTQFYEEIGRIIQRRPKHHCFNCDAAPSPQHIED